MSDGAARLVHFSLEQGADCARRLLDRMPPGAIELARPPLEALAYRGFVEALLSRRGFRLDFNRLDPEAGLALVSDQLLGPGAFVRERTHFADEIAALAQLMAELVGARAAVALRTYFAPGDLVWHVDRVNGAHAFRLVWPIGRPAGMRVTPADNIHPSIFAAFMRREHALLAQMDTHVARTGAAVEALWAHRPAQLAAMISGRFPFLRDPHLEYEVTPGAASIHRVQTPGRAGAWHRSAWANRHSPGLQIVITAASDCP